jgi:hypothetical protein
MTKWGFTLPWNLAANGSVEPPQKTNLDKSARKQALHDQECFQCKAIAMWTLAGIEALIRFADEFPERK